MHECETSRKCVHDTICKAEPWGFAISGVRSVPPHSIDLREIRLDLQYIIFSIVYILFLLMYFWVGGCVVGGGGRGVVTYICSSGIVVL